MNQDPTPEAGRVKADQLADAVRTGVQRAQAAHTPGQELSAEELQAVGGGLTVSSKLLIPIWAGGPFLRDILGLPGSTLPGASTLGGAATLAGAAKLGMPG